MSVEAEKKVKSPSQDEQIDWSWDRFISILAGETGEDERQRATSYLRSSQGYSFEQLRDAINDPEHVTSWADPWLGIRLSHPWEWIQSVPRKEFNPRNHRKPEVHEELIPLDLLVAGASIVIDGDMEYPSIPFPLLEGVARLPPAKQKPIFEKWLSFDEWMGRVSYGDPFENESDIGRGSIIGRGPGGTFHASLCYFLCPHVIDKNEKRAYYDIHVGLPWVGGSSPDTWTREEQDALWESVLKMLDALVREAEEGKPYPKVVRTTVRSAKGVRFSEFVAVIEKPSGRSFAERATLRTLERSVLRRIPVYARGIKGPTLDISGSWDGLDMLASFEIFATMYYPEDEKKRREFVAVASSHLMVESIPQGIAKEFPTLDLNSPECWKVYSEALEAQSPRMKMNLEKQRALLFAGTFDEVMEASFDRGQGGITAGEMLLFMLMASEHCPEHMSVGRAAYLRVLDLKDRKDHLGRSRSRGRSTVLNDWSCFRSVAHLWAAFQITREHGGEDCSFGLKPGTEKEFLALAEHFRNLGEATFARAQESKHGPILDPSQTWRVPEELILPSVEFEIPDLPEKTLKLLFQYSK